MQFEAQDAYYRETYPQARFLVVIADGDPVGRLYLARLADEIRLIDVALLPAHRARGIGRQLVTDIISEARRDALAVRLHVEPWNPARRMYERLGFQTIRTGPVYELMELPS